MNVHSKFALTTLCVVLSACQQAPTLTETAQAKANPATEANPVVVELYQSQGCSSCPPANAALNAIADRPGVIALSFAVTYWDRLGWKDIFGDKAYTQRQYAYARTLGNANVYTPQIVINGNAELTGIKRGELANALSSARPLMGRPSISAGKSGVTIGAGHGAAKVWLVRYDPRVHNVGVRSGENGGRNLPHKNIVRSLDALGKWNGTSATYRIPSAGNPAWKSVILVQNEKTGAMMAAKRL